MKDRIHGQPPYKVILLHGGPGAQGGMGSIGQVLGKKYGVLEPMQTADSIDGQIRELDIFLQNHADLPVVLMGWSWGAWLGWLFTARHPEKVSKLVLISSGPFEAHYAKTIEETRMSRLTPSEREEISGIMEALSGDTQPNRDQLFARFGELFSKTDQYALLPMQPTLEEEVQADIYHHVWPQASALRKNGELLAAAEQIHCPVIAIHGDYDPHPWQGVKIPLESSLENFTFFLLTHCGHQPWLEQEAHDSFFNILDEVLIAV